MIFNVFCAFLNAVRNARLVVFGWFACQANEPPKHNQASEPNRPNTTRQADHPNTTRQANHPNTTRRAFLTAFKNAQNTYKIHFSTFNNGFYKALHLFTFCLLPAVCCLLPADCNLCLVVGAWCMVPGVWCLVRGAWCLVPGA